MKFLISRHATPPFAVVPHRESVELGLARPADVPGHDPWPQVQVVSADGPAAPRTVALRAILPVGADVGHGHEAKLANVARFASTTRFHLVVVHEDGSFYDLGSPKAQGLVTEHDLDLPLEPGRNLLVVRPEHSVTTDQRPARVARKASRRILEVIVGDPPEGKLPAAMRKPLRELGMDPYEGEGATRSGKSP